MTTHQVIKDGQQVTIEIPDITKKPRKTKQTEPFARMSLELTARMAQAVGSPRAFVLVMLVHLAWQAKGQPFPFANEMLKKYGVSRDVKREVLVALEAKGLVKVERCHSRAPIVTMISQTVGERRQ
jgi:hypothetical protein